MERLGKKCLDSVFQLNNLEPTRSCRPLPKSQIKSGEIRLICQENLNSRIKFVVILKTYETIFDMKEAFVKHSK